MNTRNIFVVFSCCCMTAISCSKNEQVKESNDKLLTNQVEKIEFFLAEGARKEIITDPSIPKIETSASEELRSKWKDRIRKDVESSYNKRTVGILGPALNPAAFAVFKSDGTCGGHTELEIKMDCEDRRPATSASGWTGDSYVDGGRDVHFKLCVIDDDYSNYMDNSNYHPHGVVYLGETWYFATDPNTGIYPQGWSQYFWPMQSYIRVFDNEDSGTDNKVWVGGVEQPLTYWLGYSAHSQASYVAQNTRIHFIVSPGNPNGWPLSFPQLNIPGLTNYGLLGQFGNNQGSFNIDDEDTNNQNDGEVGGYYAHVQNGQWVINPFPHSTTISLGSNTTMRLSRVQ